MSIKGMYYLITFGYPVAGNIFSSKSKGAVGYHPTTFPLIFRDMELKT